jgi:hypothetical protein
MVDFKSASRVLGMPAISKRGAAEAALSTLGLPPAVLRAILGKAEPLPPGTPGAPNPPPPGPAAPTPMFGRTETDRILQSIGKLERAAESQNHKIISTLKRGFRLDEFDRARGLGGKDDEKGIVSSLVDRLLGGKGRGKSIGSRLKSAGSRIKAGAARLSKIPGVGGALKVGAGLFSAGLAGWSKYSEIGDRTDLSSGQKATQVGSTAAGAGLGAWGGAAAGAALGSVVPVVGNIVGGLIGAAVGGWLGGKGGEMVGEKLSDNFSSIKDGATRMWDKVSTALSVTLPNAIEKRATKILGKEGVEKVAIAAKAVAEASIRAVTIPAQAAKATVDLAQKAAKSGQSIMTTIGKNIGERWAQAKGVLKSAALQAGVDPKILARITNFESGFNPSARPVRKDGSRISSAHGYGQFLDGTWVRMIQQHGEKYGVAGAKSMTKEQALALRDDTRLQGLMLAEFTKRNVEVGRRSGGDNDDANVYALHNLGEGDGGKFLRALKSNGGMAVSQVLSPAVIQGNKSLYGDGSISVREAYQRMAKKMAEGDAYAKDIGSGSVDVREAPAPTSSQVAAAQPSGMGGASGGNVSQLQLKDVPLSPMDPMLASINTGALSK